MQGRQSFGRLIALGHGFADAHADAEKGRLDVLGHLGCEGWVVWFGLGHVSQPGAAALIVLVGVRRVVVRAVLCCVEVARDRRLELPLLPVLLGRGMVWERHSKQGRGVAVVMLGAAAGEYAVLL